MHALMQKKNIQEKKLLWFQPNTGFNIQQNENWVRDISFDAIWVMQFSKIMILQ